MRRLLCTSIVGLLALVFAAPASAEFGLSGVDLTFEGPDGSLVSRAGSHPFAVTTSLDLNTTFNSESVEVPDGGAAKDVVAKLPAGLVGSPTPVPFCPSARFLTVVNGYPSCPDSSAVGISSARAGFEAPGGAYSPVYNLEPPPGVAAKLGFVVLEVPITIEVGVNPDPPYNVIGRATNISEAALFYGADLTLWGNPVSSLHDTLRGKCIDVLGGSAEAADSLGECPVDIPEKPFLTLPRSCEGPLQTSFEADSWLAPGAWDTAVATTHDESTPPKPLGMDNCDELDFAATVDSKLTSTSADSASGLDFDLDVEDEGLTSATGTAMSDIKKVVVTLPEGMTANPSVAEGLATCSSGDLARETIDSAPGEGCPQASKVGTLEVETPLLEGALLRGSVFVAQQDDPATTTPGAENPFDTLLALYLVIRDPQHGILVKQAGKVEPDPATGRLMSTFDDIPQFPFAHLRFHFREGPRAPLATPPGCGTYEVRAELTPRANPTQPFPATSSFSIDSGPNGAPCPVAGAHPFSPSFSAGTVDNSAGSFSPLLMRLTRADGEQDLTRFSVQLPPGLSAKLAGVARCGDGAIEAARTKSGRQELASPSCPAGAKIGAVVGGAGVGSALTYVPGSLYLAGPYRGRPLSAVSIVPAVAGPFDVGTVVTRVPLTLDPRTAEVQVDGNAADPIPQILRGIPLALRDVRINVDRRDFTINPTSCDPMQVRATLFGSPFGAGSGSSVALADRYQAASCASLGFRPKLSLRLKGGTRRGAHPALRAVVVPRPGDANIGAAAVTLPHSAFLDQAHIRTVCTRVQFAAKACPAGSEYGRARAFTPLLDEPLEGPVYLRSSNNKLPDLVAALHGIVDVELVGRIDSVRGGIRNTFDLVPDAPVSRFVLTMRGGAKGLIVNSRNLCRGVEKATVEFSGQNGKPYDFHPAVADSCTSKHGKRARSPR